MALRRGPAGDTWQRESPDRAELERILGGDRELIGMLFEDSIADVLDRYVDDQRLKDALCGQGLIGTFAGPRDPGTASIHLMHSQGDLGGLGAVWGYVEGGMGRISYALAQAAHEAGAVLATGVPVAEIIPGEGVQTADGESIHAPIVIANADPKRTLGMLNGNVPSDFRERLEAWDVSSPVVKLNATLARPPSFTAAADGFDPYRAMVAIAPGLEATQEAVEAARRGEPAFGFAELYFQTAYDPSVAPEGKHVMSVFAQFAPYELAEGSWDSRRDEIAGKVLDGHRRPRAGLKGLHRATRGAGAARHRGADRPLRRTHLPGRGASPPDVGPPPGVAHARGRALHVRRRDPPGRIGDRAQWAGRGARCPG